MTTTSKETPAQKTYRFSRENPTKCRRFKPVRSFAPCNRGLFEIRLFDTGGAEYFVMPHPNSTDLDEYGVQKPQTFFFDNADPAEFERAVANGELIEMPRLDRE